MTKAWGWIPSWPYYSWPSLDEPRRDWPTGSNECEEIIAKIYPDRSPDV